MKTSDLFLFIGKCLTMDDRPDAVEEVLQAISGRNIPWEEFVWMGSSHFVLPSLYSAFERNGVLPFLPADLTEHLQHIFSLNLCRNRQIIDQCRQINNLLNPMGIRPLFLKGAGLLLSGLYHNPGDRIMEDIDILLPEKDIPGALDRLLQAGYLVHETEQGEEVYLEHHHLPPMYHPGHITTLEIHRLPVHEEYSGVLPAGEVFGESVTMDNSRVPSVKHCQLLVFLHEQRVSRGYLFPAGTLKGLYDFYLLAKLHRPDPTDISDGRFRKRYSSFCFGAAELFDDQSLFAIEETPALRRYRKKEVFILNHPGLNVFWHDYVYATTAFIGSLVQAIWSVSSRKLVSKKIRKRVQQIAEISTLRGSEGAKERRFG